MCKRSAEAAQRVSDLVEDSHKIAQKVSHHDVTLSRLRQEHEGALQSAERHDEEAAQLKLQQRFRQAANAAAMAKQLRDDAASMDTDIASEESEVCAQPALL
jgi:hypothetical protein